MHLRYGKIKFFDKKKEYGFIEQPGLKKDVYFDVYDINIKESGLDFPENPPEEDDELILSYEFPTERLINEGHLQPGTEVQYELYEEDKGWSAMNIVLRGSTLQDTYIFPKKIYFAHSCNIKKWETLYVSEYYITMEDRGNPKELKEKFANLAEDVGANCVLDLNYDSFTGSEAGTGTGTHHFTIHSYSARLGFIGKKSAAGKTVDIKDLEKIDNNIADRKSELENKYSDSLGYFTLIIFLLMIAAEVWANYDYFFKGSENFNWIFAGLIAFIGFAMMSGGSEKCSIEKS